MRGVEESDCSETPPGFHTSLGRGNPCTLAKLSALEENAQRVADDPEWRFDYCADRITSRSDDAVGLIVPGSGCSGSFRGRVAIARLVAGSVGGGFRGRVTITRIAGGRIGCAATRIRAGLEQRACEKNRAHCYR